MRGIEVNKVLRMQTHARRGPTEARESLTPTGHALFAQNASPKLAAAVKKRLPPRLAQFVDVRFQTGVVARDAAKQWAKLAAEREFDPLDASEAYDEFFAMSYLLDGFIRGFVAGRTSRRK